MTEVDKGTRIINYFIDIISIAISSLIIATVSGNTINPNLILLFIYFIYYLVLESIFGKTLGKLVTGSRVVDKNNEKASFWKIVVRTLLRFSYFDWLSYAFGQVQGTHDVISRTKLVRSYKKTSAIN